MTICIYHANCADGFGAACVVRKALGIIKKFHAASYQDPPPDVTGQDVVIVDFSYKRATILEMASQAHSILIIDHHKTAQQDLIDLPDNVQVIFDMEHSGAMLAWMHYFQHIEPPALIKHIEDRDLWRFKLYNTREIMASLFSYPHDFALWSRLMGLWDLEKLRQEGEAILRKHDKDVIEVVNATKRIMSIGGHYVPVANVPFTMASDAGHCLLDVREGGIHPPFAATYYDTSEHRVFSLRSAEGRMDVSEVAKQFGGGGHKHAAGFKVTLSDASLFDIYKLNNLLMGGEK